MGGCASDSAVSDLIDDWKTENPGCDMGPRAPLALKMLLDMWSTEVEGPLPEKITKWKYTGKVELEDGTVNTFLVYTLSPEWMSRV